MLSLWYTCINIPDVSIVPRIHQNFNFQFQIHVALDPSCALNSQLPSKM